MNMGQSGSEVLYSDGKRIAVIHVIMHEFQLSFSEKKKKKVTEEHVWHSSTYQPHHKREQTMCCFK